jgi:dTDP-4-amino-4,6-dideoxygalactose transaminase
VKNAICTPFSFAATASSLAWDNIEFKFSDINGSSFNLDPCSIDPYELEAADTIVATHVYGNPCELDTFEKLRNDDKKVIYDAAHAFGIKYRDNSVLNYGDASAISFHATKLFHTIEGGAVRFECNDAYEIAKKLINFNIGNEGKPTGMGINAKFNEYQAAVGLTLLDDIDHIISKRIELYTHYEELFKDSLQLQSWHDNSSFNGSYFPILFENKVQKQKIQLALEKHKIPSREYFSPSLDLIFEGKETCFISQDVASRVICLPLHFYMDKKEVSYISETIKSNL